MNLSKIEQILNEKISPRQLKTGGGCASSCPYEADCRKCIIKWIKEAT